MQQEVYEYAIVRIVPRVERGEFVNIGVVLYCKNLKQLACSFSIDEKKLRCLDPEIDLNCINSHMVSFQQMVDGTGGNHPVATDTIDARFRWLTAVRSSIIQTSRPHPGLCTEPLKELERLLHTFVL